MKAHSFIALFLILCALICVQSVEGGKKGGGNKEEEEDKELAKNKKDEIEKNEDVLELNPDYEEPETEEEDGDDVPGDDDDEDIFDDSKGAIGKALVESRKQTRKYAKLAQKHRSRITLALAVFAFRREIRQTIIHLVTRQLVDPKTGKLRVSPTSVLKFLLFVDFMRRMQRSGLANNSNMNSLHALSLLGENNPLMGTIVSKVLHIPMYNPAYIPPISQHYTFERVNEKYVKDGMALHKAIHAKHEGFKWPTSDAALAKAMLPKNVLKHPASNETVIILDLTKLDQSISTMEEIRDQVAFLLSEYRSTAMNVTDSSKNNTGADVLMLEVVVLLESPGGSAADYGLAAQHLLQLRNEPGIKMTICVDKVAASGGYMLACTSSPGQLFAAPFAVVGSIGVLGQMINIHSLLEGWGVMPLVFRGGKDKAPLGLIGEVTKDGKDKVQTMVDDTHRAFKRHVVDGRPILKKSIEKIGNGDIWLGYDALDLGLVDRITTSDEYIGQKVKDGVRVLKLVKRQRPRFFFARPYDHTGTIHLSSIGDVVSNSLTKAAHFFGLRFDSGDCSKERSMRLAASRVEMPKAVMS